MSELKNNILKVLDECTLMATAKEYKRIRFEFKDTTKTREKQLAEVINEKVKLFFNMDENSESFKSIHVNAKQALVRLLDGRYEFYIAELINKFLQIDVAFARKLKYAGTRESQVKVIRLVDPDEEKVIIPEVLDGKVYFAPEKERGIKYKQKMESVLLLKSISI
jgi:hypothetical protein